MKRLPPKHGHEKSGGSAARVSNVTQGGRQIAAKQEQHRFAAVLRAHVSLFEQYGGAAGVQVSGKWRRLAALQWILQPLALPGARITTDVFEKKEINYAAFFNEKILPTRKASDDAVKVMTE